MLLSGNLFVAAEKLSDAERAEPVCVPHHAEKLQESMARAAEQRGGEAG